MEKIEPEKKESICSSSNGRRDERLNTFTIDRILYKTARIYIASLRQEQSCNLPKYLNVAHDGTDVRRILIPKDKVGQQCVCILIQIYIKKIIKSVSRNLFRLKGSVNRIFCCIIKSLRKFLCLCKEILKLSV